jgi:2-polyprenyl-6-methoxyphenol hydroxylase-like FAD-dependent oxidoreductase
MLFDCDVLIVGAGPTGLMTAIELARRGVMCRIIDASEAPFEGSRGKGLQPRTLEIFEHIGIVGTIAGRAALYPQMRVHLGPFSLRIGSLGTDHPATQETPWPNMLMLPQFRTEQALLQRLVELGVEIERGKVLAGLEQDDAGVTARLETGETLRARYLVGSDGGRSTVRKAVGIGLVGETLDTREKVVADLEIPGLDRSEWHNWPTLKGVIAIAPLPEVGLFQLQAPASIDADDQLGGLERATGFKAGRIAWKSRFRHQTRMAETFRKGRVLLAGDAAHLHPPSGGQGLNTSIQDAWNLGWKLALVVNGANPALLDTYVEERMAVAASMLKLTKRLHKSASTKRGDETNQLGLNYRGGPLVSGVALEGLHPGDRLPNLALADGGCVFEHLREGKGLVLRRPDGLSITVRPDGYVAAIAASPPQLLDGLAYSHSNLAA